MKIIKSTLLSTTMASFISIVILVLLSSCTTKHIQQTGNYNVKLIDKTPDYKNFYFWAAHPWKWDPSDSISKPLLSNYTRDTFVDVFFVHPTTLTDKRDERSNASLNDTAINIKTDYSTILYQASVFNSYRVFAPRYRQAHINAFFSEDKTLTDEAFDLAYSDIKSAFEFYMAHYNMGRPIVIASHSQGTIHAARLLKELFEGKTLQNQLVCAYLIGMTIPQDYFTNISPCKDSLSTGCFVSWRTFKKGYADTGYISKERFNSYVTNPLSWNMDTGYAPAKLNKGGVLKNFNRLKLNAVDAQVHNNILWVSKPKFFGSVFLTSSNFHVGDINLFYNNIRQNVQSRIAMFRKN